MAYVEGCPLAPAAAACCSSADSKETPECTDSKLSVFLSCSKEGNKSEQRYHSRKGVCRCSLLRVRQLRRRPEMHRPTAVAVLELLCG